MRKVKFETGKFYHIYNRGVDKREVFEDEGDYLRFLRSMREFNNTSTHEQRIYLKNRSRSESDTELRSEASERSSVNELRDFLKSLSPFVEIICYCLNPNHYHLLLRQLVDNGIEKFMHKLGSGYTNFFNIKYKRSGSLFEGPFKAVKIDSEEHLLWVLAYVNGNAQIHGLIPDASQYQWCSYLEYLGKSDLNICDKGVILDKFKDIESFQRASEECFKYMQEKKKLQKYILE